MDLMLLVLLIAIAGWLASIFIDRYRQPLLRIDVAVLTAGIPIGVVAIVLLLSGVIGGLGTAGESFLLLLLSALV